jgi:hypothetical protein
MRNFLIGLWTFLESKSGVLILAFVVTTGGGALLNSAIQDKKSENDQTFEMYKMRLAEAKALHQRLLTNSTKRAFHLQQVLDQLANPQQNPARKVRAYWDDKVESTKDLWNNELYYLHAQVRVLFTEKLADMLLIDAENPSRLHDVVLDKLNEATRTVPKSLHGAFVAAHATTYHLLRKCGEPRDCDRAALLKLAEEELRHLELLHSCLSYRMAGELLRYPYGPKKDHVIDMAKQCTR